MAIENRPNNQPDMNMLLHSAVNIISAGLQDYDPCMMPQIRTIQKHIGPNWVTIVQSQIEQNKE